MVNYVSDFVCTYQLIDDEDESEMLYRGQFLQAFNQEHNESSAKKSIDEVFDSIDKTTMDLFNLYKDNPLIKNLMNLHNNNSEMVNFQMCFSYSTFYVMHKILCVLINKSNNQDECYKLLENLKIN